MVGASGCALSCNAASPSKHTGGRIATPWSKSARSGHKACFGEIAMESAFTCIQTVGSTKQQVKILL